jgi:hypothetical protein
MVGKYRSSPGSITLAGRPVRSVRLQTAKDFKSPGYTGQSARSEMETSHARRYYPDFSALEERILASSKTLVPAQTDAPESALARLEVKVKMLATGALVGAVLPCA